MVPDGGPGRATGRVAAVVVGAADAVAAATAVVVGATLSLGGMAPPSVIAIGC